MFSLVELGAKPLVQCYLPLICHVLKAEAWLWVLVLAKSWLVSPLREREKLLWQHRTLDDAPLHVRGALLGDKWPVEAELQGTVSWTQSGQSRWETVNM